MWNWKPAKAMLERLWNHGELAIAGRQGFQRVYDLVERVIPREVLEAPVPSPDEVLRDFAEQAVRARGALTEAGIKEHWRLEGHRRTHQARGRRARRRGSSAPAPRRRRRRRRAGRRRRRARPARATHRRPPLAVRQPALGPALRTPDPRLRPPDRGLQAGAAAAVRLLRAPVPARRPDRRPGRPQVGAEGRSPRRPRLPPRGRCPRSQAPWTTRSTALSTGWPARSGSKRCAGEGQRRGGAAHRRAGAGTRRLRDRCALDRAPARLSPDRRRPARRAPAAPRPLQPARSALRPRGARPAAVGGALALRVECVHLSARGPAARSRPDPQLPALAAAPRASGGCASS